VLASSSGWNRVKPPGPSQQSQSMDYSNLYSVQQCPTDAAAAHDEKNGHLLILKHAVPGFQLVLAKSLNATGTSHLATGFQFTFAKLRNKLRTYFSANDVFIFMC
jgi:hypothetical protein